MINLIEEWGKWSRHQGYERHSTPLFSLMRENGCFERGDVSTPNITDDEAMRIDSAVAKLKKHNLILFDVLFSHYVFGWSYRRIAKDYLTPLEYPHQIDMRDSNPKKRFVCHKTVIALCDRAEIWVNRNL